ncbi:hypothetical protein [Klebsiella pneumoniae]|uniref:hypothetical protein n=1 Tax=Klebsiella pneumoniae TaxID=573 RepID=UPI003314DDCE
MGSRRCAWVTSCRCVSSVRIRHCCTSIRSHRSLKNLQPGDIPIFHRDSRTTA